MKQPTPSSRLPSPSKNYFMIDIETLSTNIPNCPITQIACVYANPDEDPFFYPRFEANVEFDLKHASKGTLAWHMKQSNEASKQLFAKSRDETPLVRVLVELYQFIVEYSAKSDQNDGVGWKCPEIWCKGANFDFPILEEAYKREKTQCPWPYYQIRDERTLISLARLVNPDFVPTERDLIGLPAHDAIYDCIYQCMVHNECIATLNHAKQMTFAAAQGSDGL